MTTPLFLHIILIPLMISTTTIHPLATLNAVLNTLATILLLAGWGFIRAGQWKAHRAAMIAAFFVSTLFLVSYLTYHFLVGHVSFGGENPTVRMIYLAILLTHILLAVLVPFLAITMFVLAIRKRWSAHRRLGKIAVPIWLYVSITGVIIYLLLYHVYPQTG